MPGACNQRGYEAAGVAEDLDVSGAVDPFDRKKRPNLDLGDLYQITEEMNAGGPGVEWQEILTAMAEKKVQGLTIGSDAPDFAHLSAVAGGRAGPPKLLCRP